VICFPTQPVEFPALLISLAAGARFHHFHQWSGPVVIFCRILSYRSRGRPCPSAPGSRVYNHCPMFWSLLAVLKPYKIIHKRTNTNCSNFHIRVFLGLSNPQRQTSTLSIPRDKFGERKTKFNLETSRITQMQLYRCIHVP
jgi:hypothetical protein